MTVEEFKTMVIVKLEMLRGACQMDRGPSKKHIAASIEEFIKRLERAGIEAGEKPHTKKES
jgi:hypothetical protein